MKRRLLFLICVLYTAAALKAQFGNEWIRYEQSYYKFQVVSDGIYRISFNTLNQTIPGLTALDPRNFQLYARGTQQAILIHGEDDGQWDEGDYIEFYGRKNDGWFDTRLYPQPSDQTNPYYSLFTDTASYFLTWTDSEPGLRITEETDLNFGTYPAAPYFINEVINQQTSSYYFGKTDFNNSTDCEYTNGEGWSGPVFSAPRTNQVTNLPSTNAVSSGPPATLRISYKTISNAVHFMDHRYTLQLANQPVLDTLMEGHGSRSFLLSTPASTLGASTTAYRFNYIRLNDNNGNPVTSNSVFSNYVWRYPHNFNLENKNSFRMLLPDNPSAAKYQLNITNFNAGGNPVILYDLSNNRRIPTVVQGTTRRAIVPNGDGSLKELIISTEAQIISITEIKPVHYTGGVEGKFTNIPARSGAQFLIITHPLLRDEAQQYKDYRSSRFKTELIFVDELYDQFAYGISQHPLAIRNFIAKALDSWAEKPEYLLLLGKSVSAHNVRVDGSARAANLVPTFGYPSSDMLFTTGLGQAKLYEQALATGRISANNGGEVISYLNKLQEYEGAEPAMWMKQVMHFSGGASSGEQQTFLNYLRRYQQIIEDTLFGATVFTYQKTSTAPIEQTQSQVIADYINNGVSLMTFFGHASGTGFDVSIDDPANYNNKGRYPLLIGNSCFAGDIHQPAGVGFSQSEKFVLIPDKGTIGFIASVSLGVPSQLHVYTDTLYNYLGRRYYGEPIGKNMKRTASAIHGTDALRKDLLLETTLHGDPAVIINSPLLPDYATSEPEVFFQPADVTTEVDTFTLNVIVTNRGQAKRQPVQIEVIRNYPNSGLSDTYTMLRDDLFNRDTLRFRIPVTDIVKGGVGINSISIKIDPLNKYPELSETNNDVIVPLIIRSAELLPVWPYEYALIPHNDVTLKASTGDPFAPARNYVFEIDTTDLFNSPFMITKTIYQAGGVVEWKPPITLGDSMVYFWRVSPDSVAGGQWRWKESSFQYIRGRRGWSQDHFFQFKNNTYNLLKYQRPERYFDFLTSAKELFVNTYGYPWTEDELWATAYKIDADVMSYAGCSLDGAIYVAVFDSVTLKPWYSPENCPDQGNQFGQFNKACGCKAQKMANFIFRNERSTTEMAALRDFINMVPNGNYILAYTWIYGRFQTWEESVIQAFENLGASAIRQLPNEYPWIFFAKKGNPSTAIEIVADSANQDLSLQVPLYNSWISGDLTSTLIGPGTGWDTLSWRARNFDNPKDSIRIRVTGITATGSEEIVYESMSGSQGETNLSPLIGSRQFTHLRLNAFIRDDSLRTPVQLDRWQVTYDQVPECALNPLEGFFFHNDTLQQGETLQLAIAIQNISELPMDSMLVAYWIQDPDRNILPIQYSRQKPLAPGEILLDTLQVSTTNLSGLNSIWVEANPNFDQPEQFRFNNIGSLNFFINNDRINPLLDVTFDGIHILNGDIVSPRPEILIQLRDENPFLALDDTSTFRILIKSPTDASPKEIYFHNNPDIVFHPASLPINKAKVEMRPTFAVDGKYELIVKARDRSNNASGSVEYRISFEVINEASITNVLNYPNPFSTQTRFVFTLTGTEVPDDIRITIMTITGRVVREIRRQELGPIRIGRNITEFAWDGRDEFGDPLANGIYLYKVRTSLDGEQLELRRSGADNYFERGFGKMYLMR